MKLLKLPTILSAILITLLIGYSRAPVQEDHSMLLEASDSFVAIEKKSGRQNFCGIERYKTQTHKLCGAELYKNAASQYCGAKTYKARAHPSCPGSTPVDYYENSSHSSGCGDAGHLSSCRSGYKAGHKSEKGRCNVITPRGEGFEKDYIRKRTRTCTKPAHSATCRKAEFGIETYKTCRHAKHGVEKYKTCRKPEFGPELFKSCSYYLTAAEIKQFVSERKRVLEFMGETLVNSQGNFYAHSNDMSATACTIKKIDDDVVFDSIAAELKLVYVAKFGEEYSGDKCLVDAIPVDINAASCETDDQSRACKSLRSYKGAKKWMDVTLKDTNNLLNDIVAKKDSSIKGLLTELKTQIDHLMK